MAYDLELAERVRFFIEGEDGLSEKRMFGGLAFLVHGNLAVAASGKGGLMVRVDPGDTDDLVGEAGVDRMVMRGREMDGWLRVEARVVAEDDDLERWVARGVGYARSLPAKR
jgi:hypothetical protein